MVGGEAPAALQHGGARLVFGDEALGVFAALDGAQRFAHGLARRLGNHARPGDVFAIFGVVADGVIHVGDAAFINQVHDEFQLVQAFKIRHFGRVAGFHQGFKTGFDEFHGAAAKHGLFAKEVGFRFFAEGGFNNAGATAAIGHCIRQRHVARLAALVLIHGDELRHAAASGEGAAHGVAGRLGRDHPHVQIFARHDLPVMHVEAVGKGERRAFFDIGFNFVAVGGGDGFVRQQHHDHIGLCHGIAGFGHFQAGVFRFFPACAAFAQADDDFHAAVVEVERVGVALAAVTENGDSFALDEREVAIFIVKNLHGVHSKKRRKASGKTPEITGAARARHG